MAEPLNRVDAGAVTMVWGNAAQAKASLRQESLREFQEKPIAERLKLALSLLVKKGDERAHSP